MKLFACSVCEQPLFFENLQCGRCGHTLAYLPDQGIVSALEPAPAASGPAAATATVSRTFVALAPDAKGARYRLCANSVQYEVCNWAVLAEDDDALCVACRLNDVIPDLAAPGAKEAWSRLETAKRRLLYTLLELGLPIEAREPEKRGLTFSFKADREGESVFTGHSEGLITINVAEADDPFREKMRLQMGETYRTLLGHFRHEVGHYYWDRLVRDTPHLEPFRSLFGNETADYAQAQKRHYGEGPPPDWSTRFVSAYASMHPWEDWAETFAHYLHIVDTLETAQAYGLALRPKAVGGAVPLADVTARRLRFHDFADLVAAWRPLTVALNSLNRSMGLPDLYPFVLHEAALKKLELVHELTEECARGGGPGPT